MNYMNDSFEFFKKSHITCVRVYFYWEYYEINQKAFCADLENIARAAEEHKVECIYDNHQWNCCSLLGHGHGMPNSRFSKCDNETRKCHEDPPGKDLKEFWKEWWNEELKSNEKRGWEAQLNYIKTIVKQLDRFEYTHSFEVLNEHPVYSRNDYSKIVQYHHYVIKGIREDTDKPLFFYLSSYRGTSW